MILTDVSGLVSGRPLMNGRPLTSADVRGRQRTSVQKYVPISGIFQQHLAALSAAAEIDHVNSRPIDLYLADH
eukprot:scaffold26701_cov135-Skeletonema_menzelii.AAC.1